MKNIAVLGFAFLVVVLLAHNSFAAVGETYDQMVQKHGTPERLKLDQLKTRTDKVFYFGTAAKYEKLGAKSYIFYIDKMKFYAVFNANNVCFMMATFDNRGWPHPVVPLLIGKLVNTAPKELNRIPMRAITLQYGEGANAVIYNHWGHPDDLNASAVSKALEPK